MQSYAQLISLLASSWEHIGRYSVEVCASLQFDVV
jgi:hypothetical protein